MKSNILYIILITFSFSNTRQIRTTETNMEVTYLIKINRYSLINKVVPVDEHKSYCSS